MGLQHIEIMEKFFIHELKSKDDQDTGLELKNIEHVIIYGAGAGGAYSKYLLSLVNIPVAAFFDANADTIKNIDEVDVYLPENDFLSDEDKKNACIIISVGNPVAKIKIENTLKSLGYTNIISYIELFNKVFLMADNQLASTVKAEFYYENRQDILEGLSYFEDQESCDIYCGFVRGHALKENTIFPDPGRDTKYFPSNIEFDKGYECFIDCGATKGETYNNLENKGIIPKMLIMFEPDMLNFSALSKIMSNKTVKSFLYPCAVYSKTTLCGFIQSGTQGSSVSINSNDIVQYVALDEILYNIEPTFLKMDIEGAEYEALLGAKATIAKYKPDLAICVYHAVNHIWDIPILLKKLNPNYKFYLRSGNYFGMNTVLYATN